MFIEERHREILKRLNASGTITTAEIQRLFGIGYDSAKRDLRILEEKGLLKRTHGGAISLSAPERKETLRIVKDERPDIVSIARYAVSLIKPDEVVFLPASPVGLQMVRGLPDGLSVRVVTNSLALAEEARQRQGTKVFMIGGELDDRGCATDSFATETIRRIRMAKSFITTAGVSAGFGLSVQKSVSVAFWNAVIGSSSTLIGLYPSERFGVDSVFSVCVAQRLSCVITDGRADTSRISEFAESGVKVIVADNQE
ncbi:MAG: DeoR/GlpR family DNA-binding transcription regulator [Clostridiales bacterium]|nr:DeoR/GlpR family DNA-binding transcription regulator [Clostridiales bacterium]MDY4436125.1 DeoR/GlpR family DNA-binding transcription regulator [Candidatus Flemingibacterium sp.]